MILLVIAVISVTTAMQGDIVNLTINQPSHVVLDDCMYFEDLLTKEANLSAGTYAIRITHACSGLKNIYVYTNSGTEILSVDVREVQNPAEQLIKLDEEIFNLKKKLKEIKSKSEYLESLVETLNSINVELYNKLKNMRKENERLKEELSNAELAAQNCSKLLEGYMKKMDALEQNLSALKNENADLKSRLSSIESSFESVAMYLEVFRSLFFFVLAFLIGTYFAFMRR